MPIASGLATGVALSSYGAVSRVIMWGLRAPGRLRAAL